MPDLKPTKVPVVVVDVKGRRKNQVENRGNHKVPKLQIKARKGTLEEE